MIKRLQFRVQPPAQIRKRKRRQKDMENRHKEMEKHRPQFEEFLIKVLAKKWRK